MYLLQTTSPPTTDCQILFAVDLVVMFWILVLAALNISPETVDEVNAKSN